MNILVISNLYPNRTDETRGIFVHYQVRQLVERGHSVCVLVPIPWTSSLIPLPEKWDKYNHIPSIDKIDGINVGYPRYISLPGAATMAVSTLSARQALGNWIPKLEQKGFIPDIVNAHVALPTGYSAIPIAERYDVPLVTTIHGADLQQSIELPGCEWLLRKTFKQSARIIVNSSKLRRLASEMIEENSSIEVIPNGIPIEDIKETESSDPPKDINLSKTVIVSVGNLIPTKGYRFVIDTLSELSDTTDLQYLIIGSGPQQEELVERARKKNVDNLITFLGQIPNREVFKYLHNSDIFVLPSYQEAFGVAYIEAMACGLPTIACQGEGPEDFIIDGETGFLIPPRESAALTTILERLISSEYYRQMIGLQAREAIRNKYTWDRNAEQIEKVYQEIREED